MLEDLRYFAWTQGQQQRDFLDGTAMIMSLNEHPALNLRPRLHDPHDNLR
jgi:hypothetical protein